MAGAPLRECGQDTRGPLWNGCGHQATSERVINKTDQLPPDGANGCQPNPGAAGKCHTLYKRFTIGDRLNSPASCRENFARAIDKAEQLRIVTRFCRIRRAFLL
jgi:hypothetical protein